MSAVTITKTENRLISKVGKRLKDQAMAACIHKKSDDPSTSFEKLYELQGSSIHCVLAASEDYIVAPGGLAVKTHGDKNGMGFTGITFKPVMTWLDDDTITVVVINYQDNELSTAEFSCSLNGGTPVSLLGNSAEFVEQMTEELAELEVIDPDDGWRLHRIQEFLLSAFCNGQLRTLSVPNRAYKFDDKITPPDHITAEVEVEESQC